MGNLNVLNPFAIMRAFLSGSTPPCQPIKMTTLSNDNVKSSETHYVTLADIGNMDPCTFPDKKNPVTNIKCRETFQNQETTVSMLDDTISQLYFAGLGILGLYIFYRMMEKHNK